MPGLLLLLVGSTAPARSRVARVVAVAAGVVAVEAVEAVEVAEVVATVGVVAGVGASVAAVVAAVGVGVAVVAAVGVVAATVVAEEVELFTGEVLALARGRSSSVGARTLCPSSFTCGKFHTHHRCFSRLDDAWRAEFGDEAERPRWLELLRSGVDIFALDYDAILAAMYALSVSAEGDCYQCVPPDPCIEAAALGASEYALLGIAPAEALHTFTLDSGASHCFFHSPSLHSLHLFHTAALWDAMVTTTTPGGQRVSICMCTRTGRHLATFTRRPGSSLYTLTTEPPQGRQSAAPHSSLFSSTTAPLQTLHMDVLGPARVSGQVHKRYFLLVVDDYTRYTTVFPLRSKDLPVLRPHSDRDGEFSSDLLRDFCRGEGILQSFTLPASPQQNGIAECRIGLVMEVARTSMVHAAAPHFLWPFEVRYAAHQLNIWLRISLPETSPTLRWTGKLGDASVFRVWGSRAFVRDTSADKLYSRAIPCVFLGFSP
ncbi:unnamed protein product, partial [Closterium sp. NIES-53]